jgi:hypothetical protein
MIKPEKLLIAILRCQIDFQLLTQREWKIDQENIRRKDTQTNLSGI